MQIQYIKKIAVLMSVSAFALAGCLKDKDYENGSIQSTRPTGRFAVIEIGLTGTSAENFALNTLIPADEDTTLTLLPVVLASGKPSPEDVNVTLEQDDNLVAAYNDANGTEFAIPGSSEFTILNQGNVVTIPKGSNVGYLQVQLKPSTFRRRLVALGYKIASVDKPNYTISGNLGSAVVGITTRNDYDGSYSMEITTTGWAAYGIADGTTDTYPGNVSLTTVNVSSVQLTSDAGGTLQPALTDAGAATAFGATTPRLLFDTATNALIDVRNTTPDDGRGRKLKLDPAGPVNAYDPATHTIDASYIMSQNGRPNMFIHAVFTFQGPR